MSSLGKGCKMQLKAGVLRVRVSESQRQTTTEKYTEYPAGENTIW